jgi:exopolyphosphatase/guanosine-5'-triphosphate,3'-diphosphate pyrophosphatase
MRTSDVGGRPDNDDEFVAHGNGAPSPEANRCVDGAYAALDLGTNNCRLLIARPAQVGFRVVDSFSRIVRLGEGLVQSGQLSEQAMLRTLDALSICRDKLAARRVNRTRLIATEACRAAANGTSFIDRVVERTGLRLEVVDRETEAGLATAGCASLADAEAEGVVLFDIGGGSSEIVWLDRERACTAADPHLGMGTRIRHWTSLRLGVVTLAEQFGGRAVDGAVFDAMVAHVAGELRDFAVRTRGETRCRRFHLLGTSGTVTTLAGVHLDLQRYDRRRIDGLWMSSQDVDIAIRRMRRLSFEERVSHGCIGPDRADLVLAGCAIFEAIRQAFPAEWVRIADRGLREGLLMQMMSADGVWRREGQTIGLQ